MLPLDDVRFWPEADFGLVRLEATTQNASAFLATRAA